MNKETVKKYLIEGVRTFIIAIIASSSVYWISMNYGPLSKLVQETEQNQKAE